LIIRIQPDEGTSPQVQAKVPGQHVRLDAVAGEPRLALHNDPSSFWGPADADALLAPDGRAWRRPDA